MRTAAFDEPVHDVTPATTIHELTARYPISRAVLHTWGMTDRHTEALTLAAVAERDGIDLDELLRDLRAAARRARAVATHRIR